jgi:hypothetical protein
LRDLSPLGRASFCHFLHEQEKVDRSPEWKETRRFKKRLWPLNFYFGRTAPQDAACPANFFI